MNRRPIQILLIEQDFVGRIKFGMTITDRRKADCWKMAQQNGWISPTGKATKKAVTHALREMVWLQAANFDGYEPGRGVYDVLGKDDVDDLIAQAEAAKVAALNA